VLRGIPIGPEDVLAKADPFIVNNKDPVAAVLYVGKRPSAGPCTVNDMPTAGGMFCCAMPWIVKFSAQSSSY